METPTQLPVRRTRMSVQYHLRPPYHDTETTTNIEVIVFENGSTHPMLLKNLHQITLQTLYIAEN